MEHDHGRGKDRKNTKRSNVADALHQMTAVMGSHGRTNKICG